MSYALTKNYKNNYTSRGKRLVKSRIFRHHFFIRDLDKFNAAIFWSNIMIQPYPKLKLIRTILQCNYAISE